MTHRLHDLADADYRAGALEAAMRYVLQYPTMASSARDLLRQIDASRALSPTIYRVEHGVAEGFEVKQ